MKKHRAQRPPQGKLCDNVSEGQLQIVLLPMPKENTAKAVFFFWLGAEKLEPEARRVPGIVADALPTA